MNLMQIRYRSEIKNIRYEIYIYQIFKSIFLASDENKTISLRLILYPAFHLLRKLPLNKF